MVSGSLRCVQLPALEDALDNLCNPHLDTVRGILDDFHKQVGILRVHLCLCACVHACVYVCVCCVLCVCMCVCVSV